MRKKGTTAARKRSPRPTRPAAASAPAPVSSAPRALHYKVVELSNVDEHAIERTVNEWVPQGWAFDGVQFAMRESSKRPAMAFLFFTRAGALLAEQDDAFVPLAGPTPPVEDLEVLTTELHVQGASVHDAWARLRELAGDDGSEP
jgi:hypothetical protein